MRLMGLDYGSKTVGVAVSDPLFVTAQGLETIKRPSENKLRRTLARIGELCAEYEVCRIVIGYPLNMDGDPSDRCSKTEDFAKLVEKRTGLETVLWDERLTTVSADETLREMGVSQDKRKQHIDKIAAVLILRDYMENNM